MIHLVPLMRPMDASLGLVIVDVIIFAKENKFII